MAALTWPIRDVFVKYVNIWPLPIKTIPGAFCEVLCYADYVDRMWGDVNILVTGRILSEIARNERSET